MIWRRHESTQNCNTVQKKSSEYKYNLLRIVLNARYDIRLNTTFYSDFPYTSADKWTLKHILLLGWIKKY